VGPKAAQISGTALPAHEAWYAIYCKAQQETIVQQGLLPLGIECFYPRVRSNVRLIRRSP
jgi:hypothetical protein